VHAELPVRVAQVVLDRLRAPPAPGPADPRATQPGGESTSRPTGPREIASAIAEEIGREVDYLPVDVGGAARAAAAIGELL
jgi:hypothetical protein